jgi:phytol kinase
VSAPLQIVIAFASVAILLGLMATVKRLAGARDISPEAQRKLVHMGTGLYALTLPWLFTDDWPVFMLVGLTLIVMIILRMPAFSKGGIGETLHGVERQSYGDLLLALAVGTVFLLADGNAILYILPIATLTLADAAAALTGSRYGRKFFTVEDGQKSIEGSTAFFMITLVISMVCLLLLSDVSRPNVILLAVMVAAFGTLVEADSWRGFDNFFLPAGLLVFLDSHMNSPWQDLVGLMGIFMVAIVIFLRVAPQLGITKHAARVYIIATFLLISVTAVQNTVLPLLVFVIHAIAHRLNPCKAAYPALDIVAAIALASFGWLAIGLVAETNALMYYGLMSAGLCIGLIAVGLGQVSIWVRVGAAMALGLGLFNLYSALMLYNPAFVRWPGDMRLIGALVIGVMAISGSLWPTLFNTHRAAKLTLLALLVPGFSYGIKVMGA